MSDGRAAPPLRRLKRDISRTVRGQALAVGGATAASLLYALAIAPALFPEYEAAPLPAAGAFITVAIVAGVIWVIAVPDSSTWRDLGERLGVDVERELATTTKAYIHLARLIALYVLVALSITLLAWSTLTSGGTLVSPFSGALVAMALLSPFIAVGWVAPLVAFALVMASYWICSGMVFPVSIVGYSVPDRLVLVSAVVTNGIAIAIAALVKRGERRRLDRQRSALLEGAVQELVKSKSYADTHHAVSCIRPVADLSASQVKLIVSAGIENVQIYNIGRDADVRFFFAEVLRRRDAHVPSENLDHFAQRFDWAPAQQPRRLQSAFQRYLANFTDDVESAEIA